jgi:hypothetical protein
MTGQRRNGPRHQPAVDALGVDLQQDRDAVPALQATSVADATAARPEADTLALSQGP